MERHDLLSTLSKRQLEIYEREKNTALREALYLQRPMFVVLEPEAVIAAVQYCLATDVVLYQTEEETHGRGN